MASSHIQQVHPEHPNRLSVRNLATIGIFSILITVIAIVIAIAASPVLYFSLFVSSPLIAFITAPIYMFMVLKVHKRGTVFLYCFILALIYLISGTPYLAPWLLIAGFLGEFVMAGRGAYTNLFRISISWIICTLFRASNGMIDLWFFSKQYLASGVSREHYDQVTRFYFSAPWVLLILLIAAVGAIAGCWIGAKMLKKHFQKSGLLQ
ncbi:MptD family putative ECF transporter S component [Sporolactobacillus sp. THM19-2]|uniref:MptD family putative ECF transporter S component n=1 Tax=Sporolactobacillus sp. THM19-2 TaxID=2511171 RepID=UPI0013EC3813|nr:MptD family putative ECF transporter S component [Sporolactobacillus sp. THM19-2]